MWRWDLSFPEKRGLVANLMWHLRTKRRHVFNQQEAQAPPGEAQAFTLEIFLSSTLVSKD